MSSEKKLLKVYTIVDKAGSPKGIWLEIGVGSYNRDGSISAKLDALPVTGMIHLREYDQGQHKGPSQSEGPKQPSEQS